MVEVTLQPVGICGSEDGFAKIADTNRKTIWNLLYRESCVTQFIPKQGNHQNSGKMLCQRGIEKDMIGSSS